MCESTSCLQLNVQISEHKNEPSSGQLSLTHRYRKNLEDFCNINIINIYEYLRCSNSLKYY